MRRALDDVRDLRGMGAPLDRLGANRVRVEPAPTCFEPLDEVLGDEYVLCADAHLEPAQGRIGAVRQLDHDVLQAPDLRAGRVEHRGAQELRQHQPAFVFDLPRVVVTHLFTPDPVDWPNYAATLRVPLGLPEPATPSGPRIAAARRMLTIAFSVD